MSTIVVLAGCAGWRGTPHVAGIRLDSGETGAWSTAIAARFVTGGPCSPASRYSVESG